MKSNKRTQTIMGAIIAGLSLSLILTFGLYAVWENDTNGWQSSLSPRVALLEKEVSRYKSDIEELIQLREEHNKQNQVLSKLLSEIESIRDSVESSNGNSDIQGRPSSSADQLFKALSFSRNRVVKPNDLDNILNNLDDYDIHWVDVMRLIVLRSDFAAVDTSGNGYISRDEIQQKIWPLANE